MRITYKPVKRVAPAHPQVTALITTLLETPVNQLADVFESIHAWCFPRSDLHSWITVLNRLDEIYDNIIQEYDLSKLQGKPFSPPAKRMLLGLLRFQRMLLDNSTNRKLYNSYDKLNIILSTSDLDVLISVLQLILRPAQQYSAQPSVAQALRVSPTKFQALARQWPTYLENGIGLADLASSGVAEVTIVESLAPECSDLTFTFYRREISSTDAVQATGPSTIHLKSLAESPQDPYEILVSTVQTHQVPPEDQLELLARIRAHWIMGKGRAEQRSKLVIVRLLALAIFAHTHQESEAHLSLLMFEPDIVGHISELLQIAKDVPFGVRTAALAALDALARYKGRTQDVLSGVNAGVNHGLLMSLLRRTVIDMGSPQNDIPQSFTEALLSFISFLATHTAGGNMLIGAGIIPLLIQVTKIELPSRLAVVSKTMTLIDNILYGYPNAFQIFVGAGGVDVMVHRVKHEVETDLSESSEVAGQINVTSTLSVHRSSLLKHLLRSIHRLMHSSGTTEGLRGLIDSSLVRSITSIMEKRSLFGPSVLPLAINIMTTFIHNEPTSLHVLQEARVPEIFYSAIESGLEPVMEIIQSVPNALGALCLNQTGANQLVDRPQVLERFFDIFTSDKHVKLLQEKDNAVIVGSTIDELVRHHPALGDQVFAAIAHTLDRIEATGRAFEEDSGQSHMYRMVMEGSRVVTATHSLAAELDSSWITNNDRTPMEVEEPVDAAVDGRKFENSIIASLDVFNRFLEGLFQHVQHCKDFIEKSDGLDRLSRILALPCLPFDFGLSIGSDALVQVMRSLVEASPSVTLTVLAKQVQNSVAETEKYWKHNTDSSQMFGLLEPTSGTVSEVNKHFRSLVTLQIRITLLSDVCQVAGYPQGRAVNVVLHTLTASEVKNLVPALGSLYRHSVWEHLNLTRQLNAKGLGHLSQVSSDPSNTQISTPPDESDLTGNHLAVTVSAAESRQGDMEPAPSANVPSGDLTVLKQNAEALIHVAAELPKTLKNFFTAIVRMFLFSRRNPDSAQREQATQAADMISELLLEHITFPVEGAEIACAFAYEAVVIRLVTTLLFDDRTSDWSLHTGLLLGLVRKDVLQAIIQVVNKCIDAISHLSVINPSGRTDIQATQLLRAITCIKVAIKLLALLVSVKPISESGQTPFNVTPGKDISEPGYFEPHDLICRVRLSVLSTLRDLWRASWLGTVAKILSRDVLQAIMEILDAEGEQPPMSNDHRVHTAGADVRGHRPPEPDENRIRQLCDMGFPRSAATRALQRTSNNISAATEYLLSHPLSFPPEPIQQPSDSSAEIQDPTVPTDVQATLSETSVIQRSPVQQELQVEAEPTGSQMQTDARTIALPALSEIIQELEKLRGPIREDFGRVALALLDHNPELIFMVRPAFVDEGWKSKNLQAILDDIRAFAPSAHDIYELPLAQRFRLLALVLNGSPQLSLKEHELKGLLAHCLALLLANPVNSGPSTAVTPRWLASLLLVAHSLFIKGEELREIDLSKKEDVTEDEALFVGPSYIESRPLIFNFCLRILGLPSTSLDELHAALQLLVHLTRDSVLAKEFYNRGGFKLTLEMLRQHAEHSANIRVQAIILLRHIVEDTSTLETIMRYEISRRFSPRSRALDAKGLIRHASPIALREPTRFLNIAGVLCELVPTDPNLDHVALKNVDALIDSSNGDTENLQQLTMQVDDTSAVPSEVEGLIQSLLGLLLEIGKPAVEFTINHNAHSSAPGGNVAKSNTNQILHNQADGVGKTQEGYGIYIMTCFLMQCLAELLLSYNHCKDAFLSLTKKRSGDSSSKDGKPSRSVVLTFLLSEIVCYSTLTRPESADSRKRALLAQGGMSVILALCVDPMPHKLDHKEIPSELTSVRKCVLDAIIKAVKETSAISSIENRYGKLASLADLIYRLLVLKSTFGSAKERDDTPLQIAKLMLEKNFVATLTTTLSDIDPNYPGARSLVNNLLRPLEQLTKVAIKMARPPGRKAEENQHGEEDEGSVDGTSADERPTVSEERQETPDIYRNSALGIYGGEMEEVNYEGEDEDMLDGEEDPEEDDMDVNYDDVDSDSELTSEDMEDMPVEEGIIQRGGMDPEGWHESDDDDVADDPVDMLSADEIPADGIDADGEEVWQDMQIQEELDDVDEEGIGERHDNLGALPVVEDTDDNEGIDDQSEDLAGNLELIEDGDDPVLAHDHAYERELAQWFDIGSGSGNDRDVFLRSNRRRITGDVAHNPLFGNPRSGTQNSQINFTHPLLMEPTDNSGAREHQIVTTHRIIHEGQAGNIIASLEEVVGPGAFQFFQQLLSRNGTRGEVVGLEVPSAGIVATVERAGNIHRHTQSFSSVNERVNRESANDAEVFVPAPTAIRWTDEMKITQGGSEALRISRLGQNLIAALLPVAKKARQELEIAEKQRKQEEEERQAKVKEEEETENPVASIGVAETNTRAEDGNIPDVLNTEVHSLEMPQPNQRPQSPGTSNQLVDNAAHAMQGISVTDDLTAAIDTTQSQVTVSGSQDASRGSPPAPIPGPSRIHVQIHGTAVDITDTGIDPAFLEALPDDMREEVLTQQLREQRNALAATQTVRDHESQINPEFLEALPPEIRAELLDQEAEQARRRANQDAPLAPVTSSGPVEMDSATFLASLDPGLRQVVLMEQDETFLETLPPDLLAEVTHYRETDHNRTVQVHQPRDQRPPEGSSSRKAVFTRDSIHLLDKSGVTTLIRLLFYPQVLRKNTLQRVLINICENSKTRTEVYSSLLTILLEVSQSLVEEKAGHMTSQKVAKIGQLATGRSPHKSRSTTQYESFYTSTSVAKAVQESGLTQHLVLSRCIDTLNEIASASEVSPIFFITEQEQPASWKRGTTKKGKGKEKFQSNTPYYPLSLLLDLLNSPLFLRNSGMMDSLVALLAIITRPLTTELPKQTLSKEEEPSVVTSSGHEGAQFVSAEAGLSPPAEGGSIMKVSEESSVKLRDEPVSLLEHAPAIPPSSSRLVVNILTAGDCSGRTFQHCLALIQHLSCIPESRVAIVKELQVKAHELGECLHADLQELIETFSRPITESASNLTDDFATKFSLPSADQAKFLRILKTIEYLFSDKSAASSSDGTTNQGIPRKDENAELGQIYRSFQFSSVWQRLSEFLGLLHERVDIGDHATVLLPLIESLMVVCKHTSFENAENLANSPTPGSSGRTELFVSFTDMHRKILNLMVRNNPSLMSGSFSLLVKNPRVLDFDNKRNFFTQQLRRRPHTRDHYSTLQLNVRRARVFEDSYQYLQRKSGEQVKYGKLSIRFYNEEGVDAGGVTREWFTILARQMFNPDYALFQPCAADKLTYQPNRASSVNPEHLSFFKFVGRIIGKAIFDGRLLDAYFARSLFRQLLGKPVDYRDVEWVDPEYYKSLIWILENDPAPLDLSFIVEDSQFGVTTIVPLKENGENISVNQENKREYVQLSAEYRLVKSIKDQIDALLGGFYEIIPKSLISIFNEQEVELLIAGTPDVDVDEWRAATDYHGYTSSDPVIGWWWRALKSFNREEKAKLLGFATGTTRVPLGGFTELQGVQGVQRFSIHKAYGDSNRLPQAHTCFNQIDLPEYISYEKLRSSLLTAINEGSTGFGFA